MVATTKKANLSIGPAPAAPDLRYRQLFETSQVGLLILDGTSGVITDVNPYLVNLLDTPRTELLYKKLQDVRAFEKVANTQLALNVLQKSETTHYESLSLITKNGHPIEVEFTSNSFIWGDDPVIQCNLRDITIYKKVEESLNKLEYLNNNLAEASPVGIIYLDEKGTITYENPAMQRLMGVSEAGKSLVVGHNFFDLPPIKAIDNKTALSRLCEGETISGEVVHFLSLVGKEVDLEVYSTPLKDANGNLEVTTILALDITERKQAEVEVKRRLAELEAVNHISRALRNARDLEEMLAIMLDVTLELLHASQGSIWLYDHHKDQLYPSVTRGYGEKTGEPGPIPVKPGEGITGGVFVSGKTHISKDLTKDPLLSESARAWIPAGLGGVTIPIRAGNNIIGVFILNIPHSRQFTVSEVDLLTTLSEIAGNAIQRASLHQQTERRVQQLSALSEIDRAITSSFDLRLSLPIILTHVMAQLSVDAADILLFNPITHTLDVTSGRGFRTNFINHGHVQLGEAYAGQAAYDRKIIRIPNLAVKETPDCLARAFRDERFVSYCAVPLLARGQVKGVLEIFNRSQLNYEEDWISFLKALAEQAAIAIDNVTLFENQQRSNTELAMAYDATIEGWSRALDMRDRETEGHTRRVTDMTMSLARLFGLSEEQLVHVRRGALLHDIGKMGVPDGILLKPAALTEEEWVIMKKHPTFAYEMLSPIHYLRLALDIPYCHHEKWDGTGYPRGLKGEQIPLTARIFAVVDVWDALRSDRPYRLAWPEEKVRQHILSLSGSHFDPNVAKIFLESGIAGR